MLPGRGRVPSDACKEGRVMTKRVFWTIGVVGCAIGGLSLVAPSVAVSGGKKPHHSSSAWTEVVEHAEWQARAGLQAVALGKKLLVMGGRGPFNPVFGTELFNDVWSSSDLGQSWQKISDAEWPARGYFQALRRGRFSLRPRRSELRRPPEPGLPVLSRQSPGRPVPALHPQLHLLQRRVEERRRRELDPGDPVRRLGGPRRAERGRLQGTVLRLRRQPGRRRLHRRPGATSCSTTSGRRRTGRAGPRSLRAPRGRPAPAGWRSSTGAISTSSGASAGSPAAGPRGACPSGTSTSTTCGARATARAGSS